MKLTEQQYFHRKSTATSLTAMGLKSGRDYYHKGVHVYSKMIVGSTEFIVDPNVGRAKTFKSPYQAASHFVNLVIDTRRELAGDSTTPTR